jgi:hypothetical protein
MSEPRSDREASPLLGETCPRQPAALKRLSGRVACSAREVEHQSRSGSTLTRQIGGVTADPVQMNKRSATVMARQRASYKEAMERLQRGLVTSKVLLKKYAGGPVPITPRTVAEEARKDHTTLYRRYPELVAEIKDLASKDRRSHGQAAQERMRDLRQRLNEALSDKKQLATHNAQMAMRIEELERQLRMLRETEKRRKER